MKEILEELNGIATRLDLAGEYILANDITCAMHKLASRATRVIEDVDEEN